MSTLLKDLQPIFWKLCNSQYSGTDCYELYQQFYKKDARDVKKWIVEIFKRGSNTKDDKKSDTIRKEGNKFFANGEWERSWQYYTEALRMSNNQSESYALALANRSATLYSMKEYEYSLMDINRCLASNYPDKLRYKIYIRKLQCYDQLGAISEAENCLKEGLAFISNNKKFTITEKEMFVSKLSTIKRCLSAKVETQKSNSEMAKITENKRFLGASSLIGLRYNSKRGRHVIAETDIKVGETLFVEKAFIFAPIFNEKSELLLDNKCYNCLVYNKALIPCFKCTMCLYCDDECRTKSWNEFHQWECKGMTVNLWSTAGLGFPAFRFLLKGVRSKFHRNDSSDDNVNSFGSKDDNYEFASKLCTRITDSNKENFLLLTILITCYLETQTTFFEWLSEQIARKNDVKLKIFIGGVLLRHVAQMACNSSLIEHWKMTKYTYIPSELVPVASGLYPSVAMMNHSCKPNISLYYIDDVVVVKTVDNIKKNEEILNCYGIDYRLVKNREERQATLGERYLFDCSCEICENPKLELEHLDNFRCTHCRGTISAKDLKCFECNRICDISKMVPLEKELEVHWKKEKIDFENLQKCSAIMEKIYNVNHTKLVLCYDLYKTHYFQTGEFELAMKYFKKLLEIRKTRFGQYSWTIAQEIIKFLYELKVRRRIPNKNKLLDRDIKELYAYLEMLLPLDYADCYVKYDALKTLMVNVQRH